MMLLPCLTEEGNANPDLDTPNQIEVACKRCSLLSPRSYSSSSKRGKGEKSKTERKPSTGLGRSLS